jgi:hypothetical protein
VGDWRGSRDHAVRLTAKAAIEMIETTISHEMIIPEVSNVRHA